MLILFSEETLYKWFSCLKNTLIENTSSYPKRNFNLMHIFSIHENDSLQLCHWIIIAWFGIGCMMWFNWA